MDNKQQILLTKSTQRFLTTFLFYGEFCRCLSADGLGELLALLPGNVDGEVLAALVRHLLALGARHLLLHLLRHLLAVLLRHLEKHPKQYHVFGSALVSVWIRIRIWDPDPAFNSIQLRIRLLLIQGTQPSGSRS